MKRILLSMMVLAVASIASYAQSTGDKPFPGAKHTYSITEVAGHDYSWSVKVNDGTGRLIDANAGDVTLTGDATKTVTIDWASTLNATDIYYVQVEDVVGGCKNLRILPVTITASTFDMMIAAVTKDAICYTNQVTPTIEGGNVVYNHGIASVGYNLSVDGVGATNGWSTVVSLEALADVKLNELSTAQPGVNVADNGDGTYTVTGTGDVADILLTAVVENTKKYDNSTTNVAQITPALMLTAQKIVGQTVAESNNANDKDAATVKRHEISGISFN